MNTERNDIPDVLDPARFPRLHPELHQALRTQIKAPVVDAAFRGKVLARIQAQRNSSSDALSVPEGVRGRLRARLLLQWLNDGAMALAAVLLIIVFWPRLALLFAASSALQAGGLPFWMTVAGGALLYGLHRARLLRGAHLWGTP